MKNKNTFKRVSAESFITKRVTSIEPLTKGETLKRKMKNTPQFYIGAFVFSVIFILIIIAFATSRFDYFGAPLTNDAENWVGTNASGNDYWTLLMVSTINVIILTTAALAIAIVASAILGWLFHYTKKYLKTLFFLSNIAHLVLMPVFILVAYSFFQGSFFSFVIPLSISITFRLTYIICTGLTKEKNKDYLKTTFNGIISRRDVFVKSFLNYIFKATLLTVFSSIGFIIIWLSFFSLVNIGVEDPQILLGDGIDLVGVLREILTNVNSLSVGGAYLGLAIFIFITISLVSVQEGLEKIYPDIIKKDQLW